MSTTPWPGPPQTQPEWWEDAWDLACRLYLRTSPYPLYLRFGRLPRGRRSRVWWTDDSGKRFERGVSCFRARRDSEGFYTVQTQTPDLFAMWKLLGNEGRPAFLLTGEEVSLGTDSEPTLQGVRLFELPAGTRIRAEGFSSAARAWGRAYEVLRGMGDMAWVFDAPEEIVIGEHTPNPRMLARPEKAYWETPPKDVEAVLEAVLERSPSKSSPVHGEEHWKRVAIAGARLCKETPGADALVVLLFSILHDAMRLSDGHDPHHATRANRLAMELLEHGDLVSDAQLDTLWTAIDSHDTGAVSGDPTIAACFDADRLNLWRVGKTPDPLLLSTKAATKPETISWAHDLQRVRSVSWHEACERLGLREAEHLALAEKLDGTSKANATATRAAGPATLEEAVRERLRRWGVPEEEHEQAIRASGFGFLLKGPRGR